jgi:hypothetical protein
MDDGNLASALRALEGGEWDDGVAVGVAGALIDRLIARVERATPQDAPLWERLELHVGALIGMLERNVRFAAALFERTAVAGSDARAAMLPLAFRIAEYLRGQVDAARERGEVSRFIVLDKAAAELWFLCARVVLSWAKDRSEGSIDTQRRAREWIAEWLESFGGATP